MKMKRTALFFASTAILFSSPSAMAEQPPLNRPFISSNTNMPPQMLAQAEEAAPQDNPEAEQLKKKGHHAGEAQKPAGQEADTAAKAQRQAEEQAKQQAQEAKRAAQAEAEKAAQQQKAIEQEAKHKAAEDAKATKAAEKQAAQEAEKAKRAAQAEADKAAEQQKAVEEEVKRKAAQDAKAAKAAEREAAKKAEEAKRATEAESNKAAEQQKAVEEEARKKAAAEAGAAKATKQETAKEAEEAKKAAEQEADKAAEAQKAAEEEARKKAAGAQKAADKQTEKTAEEAKKAAEKAAKQAPVEPAPQSPASAEKPAGEVPGAKPEQATGEKPPVPAKEAKPAKPADATTGQPASEGTATAPVTAPADATKPAQQAASPLPANAAPVLDSEKPAPVREGKDKGKVKVDSTGQATEAPAVQKPVIQEAATPPAPPPTTDADVQQQLAPVRIEPVRTEKGTRIKDFRRDERPGDVQVIKQYDDRTIVEVNNNVFVESSDRPRMSRDAKDVYYEDLPRRRTRETIIRDNGVQIVTIRNRYGDVIQRSRIMPDGREVVLSYTPDYDREERYEWRDPGDDLPPLRLTIPVNEYIMDAEQAPEEDVYDFFERPPVERVERIYSIDEVKRSARIRDKVRRVDLDTITFQFGSAEIGEDQVSHLESVAKAMVQILKKNPAETFLIEGHTDAVGSDQANLVLSDKRAESVAQALTNVFDIPPENMATQGYGERYLKIKTDGPEQQNRRVAIRRITPLVAPMASNN
jgi:outer membrane protein OmpA-like peptidoglycan-associated protein